MRAPERQSDHVHALDVGRGVAIVAVIYGHALSPWFMAADGWFSQQAFIQWKFGASFLMPLFFFLSGVGWRADASLNLALRRALTLIAIAWGASIAFDLVRVALTYSGAISIVGASPQDAWHFVRNAARMAVFGDLYSLSALWFLAALAFVRIFAALAVRAGTLATAALIAGLIALSSAAAEFEWRNVHQLYPLGFAFLAFAAGHWSRDLCARLESARLAPWLVALACGAIVVFTFHLNEGCTWDMAARCGHTFLNGKFGVSMFQGAYGNLAYFTFTATAGVWFAVALSILIARYGALLARRFATWGKASMDLLIVNAITYELVNPVISRYVAPHVTANGALFFVTLLALALCVNLAALALLNRPIKLLRRFANWAALAALGFAQTAFAAVAAIVPARAHRVSQGHD
ncbi:acyltransferase family protein [Terricaulis sp.]|uniref:acyltransferase family protein n=1 Tax=Terricaulis sp. TaxID=2768686 RepID=UPI0037838577